MGTISADFAVISGIVTPTSWKKSGEVDALGIYTPSGEDILIACTKKCKQKFEKLKSMIKRPIKIVGVVMTENDEKRVVDIKKIIPLKKVEILKEENVEDINEYDEYSVIGINSQTSLLPMAI